MAGPRDATTRVSGLRELIVACDAADKATKKLVRDELRKAAEPVRDSARLKLTKGVARSPSIARTAAGYRVIVRRTGIVSVEQKLRKTTGKRPDFGALQMREALVPALEENRDDVNREMDDAVERIVERFDHL